MPANNYVYFGEIDRFGYTLQAIDTTEAKVRKALTDEYVRIFKRDNDGMHPSKCKYDGDRSYMSIFKEELFIEKREFGEVTWT